MDDAFKTILRTLGGAAVEAGVKKLDERAAKAKEKKAEAPGMGLSLRQIFGFGPKTELTESSIRKRYREIVAPFHPDDPRYAGDPTWFSVLTAARDKLIKEVGRDAR